MIDKYGQEQTPSNRFKDLMLTGVFSINWWQGNWLTTQKKISVSYHTLK